MQKILLLFIIGFIFISFTFLISEFSFAQDGTRPPPPPIFPSAPAQGVPIDGGLGLLAAAGGAYAIKKLRDKKK